MDTAIPTAAPAVTDARFQKLKAKLRELFELDKADLDFGIYRIMAAKNDEVTAFLDRQLREVVRETLTEHGAGETALVQEELDATIANLREAGLADEQIEDARKVKDLRARLAAAGVAAGADLEADIYNHLLAFFSRYYDEGDFISQRRYKGDTYAIPYSGEEVVLHWANKDQYYIKSGEWHKDYRFKLADERRVRFKLVEATQEAGNNKESDNARRRYILDEQNPVEAAEGELVLRFQFRAPTEAEKERAADGAVAIFGGDFARANNPKKGDEREQFCAFAEHYALSATPDAWREAVTEAAPSESKPARTLLGRHLDHFTARNTFDYFIHKDLGGFLRRELDFYIKNEVVRLDDLESLPADHLVRAQGRMKAIRRVAGRVIDFLAAIEDFQKKLWLKKKFVLNTSWLVTIDRVPASLRDAVAANEQQWAEWERLGFRPDPDAAAGLFKGAEWGTRAYLDACDKLVVDTRLFDDVFTNELLASEEVLGHHEALSNAVTGQLLHSDNYQGQQLLGSLLASSVACVYLDPPYNTSEATFIYKNMYRHSSWAAMLHSRLLSAGQLMSQDACLQVAIDDAEYHRAKSLIDEVFGEENYIGTLAIQTNPRGRGINSHFATSHDYIICTSLDQSEVQIVDQPLTNEQEEGYASADDDSKYRLLPFRRSGGLSTPDVRPNSEFSLLVDESTMAIRAVGGPRSEAYPRPYSSTAALVIDDDGTIQEREYADVLASMGLVEVMPIDSSGSRRVWRWSDRRKILSHAAKGDFIIRRSDRGWNVQLKDRIKSGRKPKTLWYDSKYDASSHGTNMVKEIVGDRGAFVYPKSFYNTYDAVHAVVGEKPHATVLDSFAGSGTTGHAILEINRADDGCRQFVLIEIGEYFDSVLRPRIAKVIYSPDWKDGKAQTHDKGLSALLKCFAVESYEDALNNLPASTGGMFDGRPAAESDALIRYALDLEMGPHLLDPDIFRDPWGHTINAHLAGDDEIRRHRVDLVETFNYLLGLKVSAYGPLERFSAAFERAGHDDGLGRLKVAGRLRRDPEGPFIFQRVEGVLNDGNDTRVLVVWRKLTDDPEQDAAALEAWMARHREATTERTEHRDYHLIYINGPVTLPQPTAEIRTVFPIEEAFKAKMFEDADGGGGL